MLIIVKKRKQKSQGIHSSNFWADIFVLSVKEAGKAWISLGQCEWNADSSLLCWRVPAQRFALILCSGTFWREKRLVRSHTREENSPILARQLSSEGAAVLFCPNGTCPGDQTDTFGWHPRKACVQLASENINSTWMGYPAMSNF